LIAARNDSIDSGAALSKFTDMVRAQGACELPPEAAHRHLVTSQTDGRIREIDCWDISRVAKRAGAPANVAAGVRMLKNIGDVLTKNEPLFEIHASNSEQLDTTLAYAESKPGY
jgi:thymidine phosphorylase